MKKIAVFCIIISAFFGLFTIKAAGLDVNSVSAKASVLICMDSREVIFEKNKDLKLPMASTTKIMTSLILAEQPDLSKNVTVTSEMILVEGTSMGLKAGDIVSYKDLLYGMLLSSGNDAANVTAFALGKSLKGFATLMNKKAKEIGLKNTSFVTPSGLDDENHYTTAYDLAILTAVALKNPVFKTVCSSKTATVYFGNPKVRYTLTNHNKLLGNYNGLIGVKTGFTKKSGRCLVSAAERDNKRVIAVTLNAPNDWDDHKKLLDYGLDMVESVTYDNLDLNDTLPIISSDADLIRIKAESTEFCVLKTSKDKIITKTFLPQFVYADISVGQAIGKIEYCLNKKCIASSDIISLADAKIFNKKISFKKRFATFFNAIWKMV